MTPYLRLLRIGTLFSPAADVIAGACLVGLPWSVALVRLCSASVLIYAAGMVLNDHADRSLDARQRPERPIPSGQISPRTALTLGLVLLLGGVAVSPAPLWHGGIALGVLIYDYLGKRRQALGVLLMGLLRGANLLSAVAWTVSICVDCTDWKLPLGVAGAYALYICAVTVLGIFEDARMAPPRAVVGVQTVPPLLLVLTLLALPERWPALLIGAALAVWFAGRVRRQGTDWDQAAIRRSMTWLLIGTMAFSSLVCLGSGRPAEALGIAVAIPLARVIARRVALT